MPILFHKKIFYCCLLLKVVGVFCSPLSFKLGVENISDSFLKKMRVEKKKPSIIGLITNQTGTDQQGNRTIDILCERGCSLKYIFAPEHGFTGTLAERDVHDSIDKKTGIPVVSLYGNGTGKVMNHDHIKELDFLVFDIQDSGMRHYTYISTLLTIMKLAAQYNKPVVVLDRPNPLGSVMEGPLVDPDLISFISIASIPLRHGMTIGELACYFNSYVLKDAPAQLHVIPMRGYDRTQGFMGNFLHYLSPNLQSLQSCYGYSFLGLLGEIEPFDVGVGTDMAFRCITLPDKIEVPATTWKKVDQLLSAYGVANFPYHHVNKKTNREGKGVRLEFSGINELCAYELFLSFLKLLKKEGIAFSFSVAFDKAIGTNRVRQYIMGSLSEKSFLDSINRELNQFYQRAQRSFLYKPFPCVKNIQGSFFRS